MSENQSFEEKYAPLFQEMAELVNQQPKEKREHTRRLIGEFLHDIKHQLGLVTGANAVILRELNSDREPKQSFEMIEISGNACLTINGYTDLVGENLTARINADVLKD
jgi:hypothetical protein